MILFLVTLNGSVSTYPTGKNRRYIMSCVIEHEGSEYRYVNHNKSNRYWIGHKRLDGQNFIGEKVVAPMLVQTLLLRAAVAAGFPSSMFRAPVEEKKASSERSASSKKRASNRNTISIF
jgi:hypothetical protein